MIRFIAILVTLLLIADTMAFGDYQARPNSINIGEVASNMSGALSNVVELVLSVTTIAGVVFCFVAVAKLYQHKKNPQQVPMSQFFIMLVLGAVLLSLPYILKYGNSAYTHLGNVDFSTDYKLG